MARRADSSTPSGKKKVVDARKADSSSASGKKKKAGDKVSDAALKKSDSLSSLKARKRDTSQKDRKKDSNALAKGGGGSSTSAKARKGGSSTSAKAGARKQSSTSLRKQSSSANIIKNKERGKFDATTLNKDTEHVNMDIWHGLLPNEDTAMLLVENGDFLLRGFEKDKVYRILLSVRWGNEVVNAVIKENVEKKGYEMQGREFDSLKEMIDFYQVRKRPLHICGVSTVLERPIRRKPWELRHRMIKKDKELGSGSYGVVYKGTLKYENQKPFVVAIKELTNLSADAAEQIWRESRNHHTLDHPNVVKLYGITNDYLPYILVMEYVKGGSVDQYLEKMGAKLNVSPRVEILIQAATGLDYLHSKGFLHRDIAARNLLIGNVVKVADFGMSRKAETYKIDPNKPMNLRWLAPEAFETSIVNKATDIYAFGVTMYECFTVPYEIPYAKWNPEKVFEEVMNKGYRLEPPKFMPYVIGDCMLDCLGPEKERPDFKTIITTLKSFLRAK